MPLPKINTPSYELEIPSINKKIKYRPFLVKEEKILIIAMESEDPRQITDAVKTVISNCILTRGIKVDELSTFDIEYLFLNIRGKSVGETVDLIFACDLDHGEQNEKAKATVTVDLSTITVEKSPEHTNKIELFGNVGVVMKYPTVDVIKKLEGFDANDLDTVFDIMALSIDYIYDGEQFYYGHEAQPNEMLEFVEGMNQEQFAKVENFFNNLPKLKETLDITCSKCGFYHKIDVEGLENFFG